MRGGSLPLSRSSGGKTNGHNDTIQPAILDVCPVNDSKEMDVQKENFNVVQKVKALEAFKSLDTIESSMTCMVVHSPCQKEERWKDQCNGPNEAFETQAAVNQKAT